MRHLIIFQYVVGGFLRNFYAPKQATVHVAADVATAPSRMNRMAFIKEDR
jgi:hypothetical protein